jgi:hypothetical protein
MSEDSKYDIWVIGRDKEGEAHKIKVDWYALVRSLDLPSAVEHTLKKGFKIGERSGGKSYDHDLSDMKWSLGREQELRAIEKELGE